MIIKYTEFIIFHKISVIPADQRRPTKLKSKISIIISTPRKMASIKWLI